MSGRYDPATLTQATAHPMARILRAYAGLVPIILLVALLLGFGLYNRHSTRDAEFWVDHTEAVIDHLQQILQGVADVETGARGYILSQSEDALIPYNSARQSIPEDIEALERLGGDNPEPIGRSKQLAKVIQSKTDVMTQAVSLVKAGHRDEVLNGPHTGIGRVLMTDIRK